VEELFGRPPVLGPEATLLARLVVLAVEDAVRSLEEPVFVEHGVFSGREIARGKPSPLPNTSEVQAEFRRNSALLGRPCWQIRWQMAYFEAFRHCATL
jgi:hypothetical protein